jgi:hypothetical protein
VRRYVDAERPGGLQVDDEFESGRQQHRQITGLFALERAAIAQAQSSGAANALRLLRYGLN